MWRIRLGPSGPRLHASPVFATSEDPEIDSEGSLPQTRPPLFCPGGQAGRDLRTKSGQREQEIR